MIPISISLKNFLSYGPDTQTIDFSPYNLICLSGKNGHGKSALLDAITWSIWGIARKVQAFAKPDQGLLRLGQSHMLVIFDFEFNNNRYRIRREFTQMQNKNYTQLEFGIIDNSTDSYSALTDKTSRATQQIINQTLALTFDTFCNSAFIRQGQANEFSKKSPKERKEILTTILGLDQYDKVRTAALEKIKQNTFTINTIKTLQTKRAQELQNLPPLIKQLSEIKELIVLINLEISQKNLCLNEIQEQVTHLHQLQHEKHILDIQYNQLATTIGNHTEKLQTLIATYRKTMRESRSIGGLPLLIEKKNILMAQRDQLEFSTQEYVKNQQHLLTMQNELNAIELKAQAQKEKQISNLLVNQEHQRMNIAQFNKELMQIETHIANDQKSVNTFEKSIVITIEEITTLNNQLANQSFLQVQFEKRKNSYQVFIQKLEILKKELIEISQKTGLVQIDNPSCPLCEQNLSAARKRFLKNKFEDNHALLIHRHARVLRTAKQLKLILIDQHDLLHKGELQKAELQKKELQLKELIDKKAGVLEKLSAYTVHKAELEGQVIKINSELNLLKESLEAIKKSLPVIENKEYELKKNEYKTLAHSMTTQINNENLLYIRKELQSIDEKINAYHAAIQGGVNQPSLKQEIHSACLTLRTLKEQSLAMQKSLRLFESLPLKQQELISQEKLCIEQLTQLQNKKNDLMHRDGSLNQAVHQLKVIEIEQAEENKNLEKLTNTVEDFQLISHLVGRDGIPALLIEQTIPIIEFEANQLLAKLTNNQSQLYFESLRDLKHGGTKETLEIKIADNMGIRPYELFSGGEAFRVDFALRIAIAKLLAQRAGTALQTLIIDEGFGSQDEEGLANIMDSIYKIQDDFAKIIIVSHLPFMKDNFPVHFWIEKGSNGSKVSILKLG